MLIVTTNICEGITGLYKFLTATLKCICKHSLTEDLRAVSVFWLTWRQLPSWSYNHNTLRALTISARRSPACIKSMSFMLLMLSVWSKGIMKWKSESKCNCDWRLKCRSHVSCTWQENPAFYSMCIFLYLCNILHSCVRNFLHFVRKFPAQVQNRDSSVQICIKKTFCRKISCTFVENQFLHIT